MKRRPFLKALAGVTAFAPIITKAVINKESPSVHSASKSSNRFLNPDAVTKEALLHFNEEWQKGVDAQAKNLAEAIDSEILADIREGDKITIGNDPTVYVCRGETGSGGVIINKDTAELF